MLIATCGLILHLVAPVYRGVGAAALLSSQRQETAQEQEKASYADAVAGSSGEWGWLNSRAAEPGKKDKALTHGDHDSVSLPVTGDDNIAQMAAVAETLRRYKRMLSEAQKILAAEQSSYENTSAATRQASESRVLAQIERVTQLSQRVGEESRRLQRLLDEQNLSPPRSRARQDGAQHSTVASSFSAWQHKGAHCGVVVDVRSEQEFDEVSGRAPMSF